MAIVGGLAGIATSLGGAAVANAATTPTLLVDAGSALRPVTHVASGGLYGLATDIAPERGRRRGAESQHVRPDGAGRRPAAQRRDRARRRRPAGAEARARGRRQGRRPNARLVPDLPVQRLRADDPERMGRGGRHPDRVGRELPVRLQRRRVGAVERTRRQLDRVDHRRRRHAAQLQHLLAEHLQRDPQGRPERRDSGAELLAVRQPNLHLGTGSLDEGRRLWLDPGVPAVRAEHQHGAEHHLLARAVRRAPDRRATWRPTARTRTR